MTEPAIETKSLCKEFKRGVLAVDRLNLTVERGTVYGLIGRNACGKTTLLRLVMGLLHPTNGEALVFGEKMMSASPEHRARVAYVSQACAIPEKMRFGDLCKYVSYFYPRWDGEYAAALSNRFGLDPREKIAALSGGQKRKAAIVLAFATRADLLILDEPAANLDPIARRELIDEIVDIITRDVDATVVLSTHIISDLERIAETVGMMDAGKLVYVARLEEMRARVRRVQVVFDGDAVPEGFAIPHSIRQRVDGRMLTAVATFDSDVEIEKLKATPGANVEVFPLNLEDAFIELLGNPSNTMAAGA